MLRVEDNRIIIDWFHKKTFSGRYLSYFSYHPLCQKVGAMYSLVDRAILLSHPIYQQKNLEFCITLLRKNGYPLDLIFKTINTRIKTLINKLKMDREKNCSRDNTDDEMAKKIIVFPYIRKTSEKAAALIDRSKFIIGLRCINRIDNYIKVHKDKTDYMCKNNTVYKIECNNCNATYVGQTKRHLKTRINEHMKNRTLDESRHSVVTSHMIEHNHSFKWQDATILDSEPNYKKRLISEMLHIKEQINGINLQKDTEFLEDSYYCILDTLANKHM
jgi:hypothetical protein